MTPWTGRPLPAAPRMLRAVLALLLLAGCAGIPDSGPVRDGEDLRQGGSDSEVRVIGQPPPVGAQPVDVVTSFLQAGADFEGDHAVARAHLAPGTATAWQPGAGTTVVDRAVGYSLVPLRADEDRASVQLRAPEVARIDAGGHFARVAPGSRATRTFGLRRVDGQWRIDRLDPGLVLTTVDVLASYRPIDLFWVGPSGSTLTPDRVYLPAVPGLPTAAVTKLLAGPSGALADAVSTAFPPGTALAVSSVPVRGGVAQVDLDAAAGSAGAEARRRMSAQLSWTLRQLPGVEAVDVTIDGGDIGLPGVPAAQPLDAWRSFDPGGLAQGAIAYTVRDGRLGRQEGASWSPLPGPLGDGRAPLAAAAVSLDASSVAAVAPDGGQLLVGPLVGDRAPGVRFVGADLGRPSYDATGNLWVVETAADGRSTLWVLPPQGTATRVAVAPSLEGRVRTVRVARDGARVAMVVAPAGRTGTPRLYVGTVQRSTPPGGAARVRVVDPVDVVPDLVDVRDVAWADAFQVVALGRRGEDQPDQARAYRVTADGFDVSALEPQAGLVTVAAAPGSRPLLATTADGRVLQYSATRRWVPLGSGSAAVYAG